MELQQDFLQRRAVGVGRCLEVLAPGFGRNVVRNFLLFADQEPYMRGAAVPHSESYGRGFQEFINEVISLRPPQWSPQNRPFVVTSKPAILRLLLDISLGTTSDRAANWVAVRSSLLSRLSQLFAVATFFGGKYCTRDSLGTTIKSSADL